MHPHIFLLLLSSGVSSYFLPQKEMPRLLNETKYSLIDEMLCLLKAEHGLITKKFSIPFHVKKLSCAHKNTEIFIHELKRIHERQCMRRVEKDMEKLERNCDVLEKSSLNDNSCLKKANSGFSKFKESLEDFLRWVNGKLDCRNVGRSELGLYLDGECSCHDSWKSHRGLG
uniref:Interleukin-7 n=1 Tax=Taeniopygia guttata TaxID=59729 RepID=H0YSX5_TAEGU